MQHLTLAQSLAEMDERQRLVLLGAMQGGAALHAAADRSAVVGWHVAVGRLLQHTGAQRRGEVAVALDAVGLLTEAAAALSGREIEAVAVGLLLALEDAPTTQVADFLYSQVLILDEEQHRRPVGANAGPQRAL